MKQDKEKQFVFPFSRKEEKNKVLFFATYSRISKPCPFAESCTGGGMSYLFSSQAGASHCFKGGLVSYALHTKSKNTEYSRRSAG